MRMWGASAAQQATSIPANSLYKNDRVVTIDALDSDLFGGSTK